MKVEKQGKRKNSASFLRVIIMLAVVGGVIFAMPYLTGSKVIPSKEYTPEAKKAVEEAPILIEEMFAAFAKDNPEYELNYEKRLKTKLDSMNYSSTIQENGDTIDGLVVYNYYLNDLIDDKGNGWADPTFLAGYWFKNEDYAKNYFADQTVKASNVENIVKQTHNDSQAASFNFSGYPTIVFQRGSFVFMTVKFKDFDYKQDYYDWLNKYFGFEWDGDFF